MLSQQTEFDFQSNSYVAFAIVPTYISTADKPLCRFPKYFKVKMIQNHVCPTAEEISIFSNDNNTYMRERASDSMASLTSMTCDDDLRGACSKGWEPSFIGGKGEMERLSKLRKSASLPYIHQRNPSFSYKSKGIGPYGSPYI